MFRGIGLLAAAAGISLVAGTAPALAADGQPYPTQIPLPDGFRSVSTQSSS
jgi:hypothetical protein